MLLNCKEEEGKERERMVLGRKEMEERNK